MSRPDVVSAKEWEAAQRAILAKEEATGSVWTFLDLAPLGRQERWEDSPPGAPQGAPYQWWRRHDEYER